MFSDILACASGKRELHFFGSVVRVADGDGALVIDGQQRLTTISLLLLAIKNEVLARNNPGDSEFAQAGLEYTTDAETGFIGFHTQGNYDRAISDCYALMGVSLFAEYVDGIAKVTVNPQ